MRFAAVAGGLAVLTVVMVGVARVTGGGGPVKRPLGTEVLVGVVDTSGGDPGVRTQIGLTVLRVRKGTQRELASNGLKIDSEDRDSTPFYIDARFANKGRNAVTRNLDVGLDDTDGNLVPSTIIFNFGDSTFAPCPSVTEGTLEPGQSYESCTLVLVPASVEAGRVHFLSDKGADRGYEFVYWEIE